MERGRRVERVAIKSGREICRDPAIGDRAPRINIMLPTLRSGISHSYDYESRLPKVSRLKRERLLVIF